MEPSIGRIVHYTLTESDAARINKRREDFMAFVKASKEYPSDGYQAHVGNAVRAGDVYPAIIVRVWATSVNLRVILDGTDDFWATSISEGEGERHWSWPPRV
ncbi:MULTISPECIES: hypothetical protein [Arthrobacter]|uniref:Uncharacterized protein n=1 Tax=Arthrobacter terricola TaxID=2547396 RepID=A0A4V2ZTH6_9MICC|nr:MULTISPECIES: hypothetical protein [Arthrobacter]MBT8161000.1 hypothetical protein [Arthrobacter sp. GN70]TDF96864.1 hypothetical protein E1809_09070 [Arthrobacter terricola]